MKITVIVGKIHLQIFFFLKAASRGLSEENFLFSMRQLNLKKNSYDKTLQNQT